MKKKYRYDYILCGYYGFGNIGDDAVLGLLTEKIKEREPSSEIAVISEKEYPNLKKSGVEFISRRRIIKTLNSLSASRMLIFGGGSLLQDVTSRRSLMYYAAILKAGQILSGSVTVMSNGIGPLSTPGKKIVAKILKASDRVSVRDPESYNEAVKMGACPTLSADPVFLMETAAENRDDELPERFFAVSLRETAGGGGVREEEIAALCEKYQKLGLVPVFVPMQESADGEISRRTAKKCGGKVVKVTSAGELLSLLSAAEFSIGMRLHFLLLSLMAGKPTVALSYDVKIDSAVPYAGGECVLKAENATAAEMEKAVEIARKNTDGEFLRRRCSDMQLLAKRDMDNLCAPQTLVKTLYSKSV